MRMRVLFLLLMHCFLPLSSSWSESPIDRRKILHRAFLVLCTASGATTPAQAACLSGDLSAECIGVYKVPLMDEHMAPYVGSEKALKAVAPDIRYVKPMQFPDSLPQAMQVLSTQQLAAQDIQSVIMAGKLEEGGIKLLNLIPRVTAAGRVVLEAATAQQQDAAPLQQETSGAVVQQLKVSRLESKLQDVLGSFGQCDISIGQGLRGEMGSITVAQLTILSELKDATIALEDFVELAKRI